MQKIIRVSFHFIIVLSVSSTLHVSTFAQGPPELTSFGPSLSFVYEGNSGITFPTPLTVELDSEALSNTFVYVSSAEPSSLTVDGGGVTIFAGQTSAEVLVNGLIADPSVILTAMLGAQTLDATVRVLGAGEVPVLDSLRPETATVLPGGTLELSVFLDIPAPASGTDISISLSPPNAGSLPSIVSIPEGETNANFQFIDAQITSSCTITATLDGNSFTSQITIDQTVSVGSTDDQVSSKVYPNPAKHSIFLEFNNVGLANQKLVIFDAIGRMVHQLNPKLSSLEISTEGFETGVYYYYLINSDNQAVNQGQFVIQ